MESNFSKDESPPSVNEEELKRLSLSSSYSDSEQGDTEDNISTESSFTTDESPPPLNEKRLTRVILTASVPDELLFSDSDDSLFHEIEGLSIQENKPKKVASKEAAEAKLLDSDEVQEMLVDLDITQIDEDIKDDHSDQQKQQNKKKQNILSKDISGDAADTMKQADSKSKSKKVINEKKNKTKTVDDNDQVEDGLGKVEKSNMDLPAKTASNNSKKVDNNSKKTNAKGTVVGQEPKGAKQKLDKIAVNKKAANDNDQVNDDLEVENSSMDLPAETVPNNSKKGANNSKKTNAKGTVVGQEPKAAKQKLGKIVIDKKAAINDNDQVNDDVEVENSSMDLPAETVPNNSKKGANNSKKTNAKGTVGSQGPKVAKQKQGKIVVNIKELTKLLKGSGNGKTIKEAESTAHENAIDNPGNSGRLLRPRKQKIENPGLKEENLFENNPNSKKTEKSKQKSKPEKNKLPEKDAATASTVINNEKIVSKKTKKKVALQEISETSEEDSTNTGTINKNVLQEVTENNLVSNAKNKKITKSKAKPTIVEAEVIDEPHLVSTDTSNLSGKQKKQEKANLNKDTVPSKRAVKKK